MPRPPTPLCIFWLLVLFCAPALRGHAAEASRRAFNLPADDADRTLRLFASQSGLEVLFSRTSTNGVRTPALLGDFPPFEAITRLLAGSRLIATQDAATGAIVVTRATPAGPSDSADSTTISTPMTPRQASRLSAALALLAGSALSAQTPATPPTAAADDKALVLLSPFEVKEQNDGYYAANTTSGTRLNSSLDDLASSTTIVTKKQMADFALLDINDLFAYEAGTEGSATYTDAEPDRNGSAVDTTSNNPSQANRVRGVGAANISFGNFASNGLVPIDPSNIDGVEISRGPNSSIFGLGNVSGTVNLMPASANVTRNRSSAAFRVDSYDGYRTSLDLNRVIVPRKLALRGSVVFQHDGFERKPSGVDSVRLNGMIRFQPFSKTSITGTLSSYRSWGTLVNQTMPRETITAWKAAGSPTWDPVTATARLNGSAVPGNWTTTNLPAYFSASQFLALPTIFVQPDGNASWWGPSRTTSIATSPATPNQNVFLVNTVPGTPSPAQPLFPTDPATGDRSLYDYTSLNLAALNYTQVRQNTSMLQLEQIVLATPRQLLAFQGGLYKEAGVRATDDMWGTGGSGGRTGYLYVDVNERMVDGTTNPNLGRPFLGLYNLRARVDNYSQRATTREQLAYRLDLRNEKNVLRWLGMHTLSAYHERRTTRTRIARWQDEIIDNSQSWYPFPTTTRTATAFTSPVMAAQPFYRFYVGDNQGQNADYAPHKLNPGVYDYTWGNGVTGVFNRTPARIGGNYFFSNNNGWTYNLLKTHGAALQSFMLKDRVVTTFGLRKDRTWDRNPAPRIFTFGPDGYGQDQASLDILSTAPATTREGSTKTAGVVVKATSWLRLHANASDSFLPASLAQVGLFRNLLPNPTGEGRDYGASVTLLGGKLVARLNRYSTVQVQARNNNGGTLAQRVQGVDLTTTYTPPGLVNLARGWITRAATAQGVTLTTDQVNQRISDLTKLDEAYWTSPQSNSLVYAPSDLESKGYEFELNYNPTRHWAIKFNATQTEAVDKNLSGDITRWIAERMPVWTSIIDPELNKPFFTERYGAAQSAQEFLQSSVLAPLAIAQATEGKSRPQIRKYRANFLSSYQLAGLTNHKWLKRVTVGGALRWEDKGAIGYHGIADAAGVYQSLDPARPIYDAARLYVDLFGSYRTRFFNDKVNATFQLNVRNAQEDGRLQAISAFPNGKASAYRIVDPRQFVLSVTFDL
ncbi:TonB-dependent receptor plug domain-containing protein [Horticoccus sp. 23ND18S-11]|uniref:TonB-dependent receptor plug domain-containing protein n=1 Tax=Horticoccus sp. 23ND18S-11 TaxID=3391832 RepID=UPI0039C95430